MIQLFSIPFFLPHLDNQVDNIFISKSNGINFFGILFSLCTQVAHTTHSFIIAHSSNCSQSSFANRHTVRKPVHTSCLIVEAAANAACLSAICHRMSDPKTSKTSFTSLARFCSLISKIVAGLLSALSSLMMQGKVVNYRSKHSIVRQHF